MPHKNPEEYKRYQKGYREAHRAELRAKNKAWNQAHPESSRLRSRRHYLANRKVVLAKSHSRYRANPKAHMALCVRWQKAHPGLVRQIRSKHGRKMLQELPDYYVRGQMKHKKPTKTQIEHYRTNIKLWRTQNLFRAMAVSGVLSSK